MRELLEEQKLAPDEPRAAPSRERLLHAIDAEIEKLSDVRAQQSSTAKK